MDVSFEKREARVWGLQASLPDLIEAVEDVGFEAMLHDDANGDTDGDDVDDDADPDAEFAFVKTINPDSDLIKVTNLVLQVDGVMNVEVLHTTQPQRVKVWGFIDNDSVVDALLEGGFSVKEFESSTSRHAVRAKSPDSLSSSSSFDGAASQNPNCFVAPLLVGGMSCANCSKGIENRLAKIPGILAVRVALLSGKVEVHYDITEITDSSLISQAIIDMGYTAVPNGNPYAVGSSDNKPNKKLSLMISGMSCGACATKIEDMLLDLPGVKSATVSCLTERALVEIDDTFIDAIGPRDVMSKIDEMGYKAQHVVDEVDSSDAQVNSDIQEWWRLLMISMLLGGPVVILHFSMIFSSAIMDFFDVPVCSRASLITGVVNLLIVISTIFRRSCVAVEYWPVRY